MQTIVQHVHMPGSTETTVADSTAFLEPSFMAARTQNRWISRLWKGARFTQRVTRGVIPQPVDLGPTVIDKGPANQRTRFNASAQLNPVANSKDPNRLRDKEIQKAKNLLPALLLPKESHKE